MVGMVLAVIMLANLAVQCFLLNQYILSLRYSPSPYVGLAGCFITSANQMLWGNLASYFVVQALVLTLMVISAFRFYNQGYSTKLTFVIHRDGIVFYVFLLLLTGANIALTLAAPFEFRTLLVPIEGILYSALTTRILLNIRSVGSCGHETELHTSYIDARLDRTPLGVESLQDDILYSRASTR